MQRNNSRPMTAMQIDRKGSEKMTKVQMIRHAEDEDWMGVKRRALVTVGKHAVTQPDERWKEKILAARHSPIRYLQFSFYIECPYWVSVHLCRHIHAQPYVRSQRNDRQSEYDRDTAPQNEMVSMIFDVNAEELMVIANKRLCRQAAEETRKLVQMMCDEVVKTNPEFEPFLVPMCAYHGGVCHEMSPCGGV